METDETAEPAPPQQKSGLGRKLGYGAVAVVVLFILLAEFTGVLSKHQPAQPAAAVSPSASPSPRPSPAPSVTSGPQQKFEAWRNGPGWIVFQAFRQGQADFAAASQSGNQPLTEEKGAALVQDAEAAARKPPPVATRAYTRAMTDFATAGHAAASGDFSTAAAWFNQAARSERAAVRAWKALATRT